MNASDPVAPAWNWPSGLWSLWDMEKFPALSLINDVRLLQEAESRLQSAMGQRGPISALSPADNGLLRGILFSCATDCNSIGLSGPEARITDIMLRLDNIVPRLPCNLQIIQAEVVGLRFHIMRDLGVYSYMLLNKTDKTYFEQERLFGDEVYSRFESAREDIKEAGSCLALNRSTATVFHCMRVLEIGLGMFAAEVSVPFGTDQWHIVINNIEAKLKQYRDNGIPGITDRALKNTKLQFYSEAAKEFAYFKDAWRNYVSHAKAIYDQNRALSVLDHTKTFMCVLSRELHE
jgi:hypothetical protein